MSIRDADIGKVHNQVKSPWFLEVCLPTTPASCLLTNTRFYYYPLYRSTRMAVSLQSRTTASRSSRPLLSSYISLSNSIKNTSSLVTLLLIRRVTVKICNGYSLLCVLIPLHLVMLVAKNINLCAYMHIYTLNIARWSRPYARPGQSL